MTSLTRLRQAVLVARDYSVVAAELQREFGLENPFHDPSVAEFGLCNGVFAVGDTFVEIVSPTREGTTAGRFLDRSGADGGYMVMFQIPDAAAARQRMTDLGVRVIWTIEFPDIVDFHLHPKDVPGAIVSLTAAVPAESWRWAGPTWQGQVPDHGTGMITSMTVRSAEPAALAARWAAVLAEPVSELAGEPTIALDEGRQYVRFVAANGQTDGICGIGLAVPSDVRRGRTEVEVGGVVFNLTDAG